jgi:hypothetical protein
MYRLITASTTRALIAEQLPAFSVSLLVSELFYKFHSFTLECLAFLATWFVVDGISNLIRRTISGAR